MSGVPVRALASLSREVIDPQSMESEVDLFSIPSLDASGSAERIDSAFIDSGKLLLRGGEVLISKLNPRKPRIHLVPEQLPRQAVCSPEFVVLNPAPDTDRRFLAYSLLSERVRQDLHSEVRSATRSHQRVEPATVMGTRIYAASPEEQRRIADFLDHQLTRIDSVVSLRARHATLLQESFDSFWARATGALPGEQVQLRRVLTSIVDGPFGSSLTSSHYSDDGTRVVRLGNIGIASFRDDDKAYIPSDYGRDLANHAVTPGDLLMAGLGDERWPLGRCCVAPDDLGPAIVKADCYRLRLASSVSAHYAAWYLSSHPSRQALLEMSRGATRARLNTAVAREALIRLPSRTIQDRYVTELEANRQGLEARVAALKRLLAALGEAKQSLITAAVSGEFDVSAASGRSVPVTA